MYPPTICCIAFRVLGMVTASGALPGSIFKTWMESSFIGCNLLTEIGRMRIHKRRLEAVRYEYLVS